MYYFKYQNKVFETPNLEKKLKRLKITLDMVEILDMQPIQNKVVDIPEWIEKGLIKHKWLNKNPNSKEYKYSYCGYHDPNDDEWSKKKEIYQIKLGTDWVYEEI